MLDTYLPVLSNFSTAVAGAGAAGAAPRPRRRCAAARCRAAAAACTAAPPRRPRRRRSAPAPGRQRRGPEAAADVNVARLVDGDARRIMRPVEAFHVLRLPAVEQRAGRVELEDLRRGKAARARPRFERRALLVGLQRVDAAMDDPDVILRVDGHARHLGQNPRFFLRERFRPQRLDFHRRRRGFRLRGERHERRRRQVPPRPGAPTRSRRCKQHASWMSPLMRHELSDGGVYSGRDGGMADG